MKKYTNVTIVKILVSIVVILSAIISGIKILIPEKKVVITPKTVHQLDSLWKSTDSTLRKQKLK